MHTTLYLAAWLIVALLAIAMLSAMLARYKSKQDLRRIQAHKMTEALHRYSDWVCAQRLTAVFQGEGPEAAAALDEAGTIRLAWFPELAADMGEVMAVRNRIVDFLTTQQQLWQSDPEQWLESDHDKRFMALWRQHQNALHALLANLEPIACVRIVTPAGRHQSTYA